MVKSFILVTCSLNVQTEGSEATNWGIQVFVDHTRRNKHKQNVFRIFACHVAFHMLTLIHPQIAVHRHLSNHCYFDPKKTWIPPIWAPCQDKGGFRDLQSISVIRVHVNFPRILILNYSQQPRLYYHYILWEKETIVRRVQMIAGKKINHRR